MSEDPDFEVEVVENEDLDSSGADSDSTSKEPSHSGTEKSDRRDTESKSSNRRVGRKKDKIRSGSTTDADEENHSSSGEPRGPQLIDGVLWSKIDRVSNGWDLVDLGPEVSIQTGYNAPSENFVEEGGIPLVRNRDLGSSETEIQYDGDYGEEYVIEEGDLLVSMDGEFEPHLWTGRKALLNQRVCKVEGSDRLDHIFLSYAIEKPLYLLQKMIAGTTVKHLSKSDIRSVNLPTPPLPEQRKIASVLYAADQAIQKTEEIIKQAKRVKRGLMQSLFSQGLYDQEFTETDTRFGELPSTWRVEKLGEVGRIAGRTAPEKDDEECWGGAIPWATPSEITNLEGNTIAETKEYLTDRALEKVSSNLLPAGSILLTTRATVGACAVNEVPMTTNQGFKNVIPGDDLDTWYGYYRLTYESNQLEARAKGSTFREVGKETVENFKIPIPPTEEQEGIGKALKSIDDRILNDRKVIKRLECLKKGLMQDLLTGEVRTADKAIDVLDEVKAHG
jgi:type I restriction enzyme S subunit